MSEITKPIALDESLHTTEPTPRNLADVLSDELQNLATAISGGSDKVPKTDIATVEPTNTASRAYSVGELVYVNGNLYKVITSITIGATFTVGTNIQSANVSGTVKDALDKVGKLTKLWENPNPSADFSPTSIAVGENYDQMMIVADSNTLYVSNTLGATTSMFLGTIGGVSYGFARRFAYQGGNVIIQDGYSYKISDGTRATNNSIIIPLAIYGIKY